MKVKELKKLINIFDEVKDTDFIKNYVVNYNVYLYWGHTYDNLVKLKELNK